MARPPPITSASSPGHPNPASSSSSSSSSSLRHRTSKDKSLDSLSPTNSRGGSPRALISEDVAAIKLVDEMGLDVPDLDKLNGNGHGTGKGTSISSASLLGDGASDFSAHVRIRGRKVDQGYTGEVVSETHFEEDVGDNELAQRDYLQGPSPEELFIPLRRPSPLGSYIDLPEDEEDEEPVTLSSLPSPAISINSTSSSTGILPTEQTPLIATPTTSNDPTLLPKKHTQFLRPQITLDSTPSRPRPRAYTLSHSAFGSSGTFPSTARAGPVHPPTLLSRIKLFYLQLFANAASAAFLVLIVVWALGSRGFEAGWKWLKGVKVVRERREWETDEYEKEKVVKSIQYYARNCGFDVVEQEVETKDGYLLKVFKVICLRKKGKGEEKHSDGRGGYPVLIQHGLFQSCGSFITSEERSLAFWLAEHGGYQVYLGNNRGVMDMGHVVLKRSDPRFWDFNIKELALYDLPALVDHVRRDTGYDQIAFIGHSQGNATMFCSLAQGMVPELGEKLSIFVALAPAVYAGPLTTGFPFGYLKSMKWKTWRRWFGVLDFIPLMRVSYDWTPSKPFGLLGYQMFAFLFNWTDTNWLLRRKPKKFRFTPSPVSSASIFWWTGYGGFSTRGCVLDPLVDKWFDKRFPPLAIHHGGRDYLVLTEPLLKRLSERETDVKVIRVKKMEEGEHCDFFWHIDAVELVFHSLLEDIEKTRPRYPEEEESESSASSEGEEEVGAVPAPDLALAKTANGNENGIGKAKGWKGKWKRANGMA